MDISKMHGIQVITFILGLEFAIGGSLSAILVVIMLPTESMAEMLDTFTYRSFKKYFGFPTIGVLIGIVCIALTFFLPA